MELSVLAFEKTYPSIGQCIFCNIKDVPLAREHIIPDHLGGRYIFLEATCKNCETLINKLFETKAAQTDFLVPRLLLDLKKKTTSKMPPVSLNNSDLTNVIDNEEYNVLLDSKDYPPLISLIMYPEPGLFSGIDQTESVSNIQVQTVNLKIQTNYRGDSTKMREKRSLEAFPLSIIKMAYSYAIAEKGPNYFNKTIIRDIIFGRRTDYFQYFGRLKEDRIRSGRYLHKLYLEEKRGYLVCVVHLFASCGMAPYQVILGKLL